MTTINLRDGLEVLYYFGEQDFDAQRNQLQDHSGYGRHLDPTAAVTFGDNGVNSFESSFFPEGSLASIPLSYFDSFSPNSEFTGFILVKKNLNVSGRHLISWGRTNGPGGWHLDQRGGSIGFHQSNNSFGGPVIGGQDSGQWNPYVFGYDGNDEIFIQNVETGNADVESDVVSDINEPIIFGKASGGSAFNDWSGNLAVTGLWSRVLTGAERQQLGRLTSRLRAQL